MLDLFAGESPWQEPLADGAVILRRQARELAPQMLHIIDEVSAQAPFRHLITPGGHTMSVAMTNCGQLGWVSDRRGYRYESRDPLTGKPWPALPKWLTSFAHDAAGKAGYPNYIPDACLINRYQESARMTLHQDKDEQDKQAPIVSVSLGVPAVFLFGGLSREAPVTKVLLEHGDVVVWGGVSRLNFHGIMPVKAASHPSTGNVRFNLTFRLAGKG
ncbi:alpha-ketoglutarate-dependent dioxygenase AlkB [Salmonella enterica subsp. enterica serovar Choleraesuis]|nr:alpha-ketoglutarate-dependent dioxygenase AlkB [Salmonella enterica subsp. enterica serovar Choleraesuis]